jgi:beta-lactamase regulating signal transducer with metallopeptidase domain
MNLATDAISSALVHSLWQSAGVALLLWIALVALRHRSANARYLASCVALALMVALPVVTAFVLSQPAAPVTPVSPFASTAVVAPPPAGDTMAAPAPVWVDVGGRQFDWLTVLKPWMLPLWLAGVLVCSLRLVLASMHTMALRRQCAPEPGPVTAIVSKLAARMGVRRSVSVRIAQTSMTPATFGLFRPVILLSSATVLGITPQQLEAVLAHELAHIRRHDYLVNVLQMLAETLFFYHPAVWWASRRIRVERELCCDDVAVQACGDVVCYAQALTSVARLQIAPSGLALGSAGGPLLMRIQRLLGVASVGRPVPPLSVAIASVVLIVATFTGTYAQSSPGTLSPDTGRGAVVRGRVVDARTGTPIVGASVRVQYVTGIENPPRCPIGDCEVLVDPIAGPIPVHRVTTTVDGRFEVRGMKPGDYEVAAVAPGYIQRYFGQTSDDMPEVPVHVAAGQSATAIEVRLEPAGSVSGRIFSDSGDGLAGVEVELLRRRAYLPGGTRPMTIAFAQTEDMGTFRFRNVPAGEYYIRAYTSSSLAPTRGAGALSYTATFFPDATDVTLAQPVIVGGGQELAGVDFALTTARKRTVSGRLVDPGGGTLATAMVSLFSISAAEDLKAPVATDGRFRIADVPEADYMLRILDRSNARSWTTAFREVSVRDDVTDLELVAGLSVWIDGRVVQENGQPLPFDPTNLQMSTEQQTSQFGFHSTGSDKVAADGTFSMRSGTGTMSVRVSGLPPRWFVKSLRLDGVDVTDTAFELPPDGRRRLEIRVSDRVGRLSGVVTDREARAVSNALILVFPEDLARLNNLRLSDRMRVVRTAFSQQRGRYEIDSLPISSYRVVAVASLPRNAWTDPEVVDRLWPFTTSVSLDELRASTLHLKVVPAPTDLLP